MATPAVPVPALPEPTIGISWLSMRFCPTPGTSATTLMLNDSRCARGPTPLSMRICGELKAPPDTMTSRLAMTVFLVPALLPLWRKSARYTDAPSRYSTPTARGLLLLLLLLPPQPPAVSNSTLVASELTDTVRLEPGRRASSWM